MTVRAVVTASGRVSFGGTGLRAARARSRAKEEAPIDGPLRVELERALAVADRANNAVLQERDGRWTVQGDPTEGALVVAARKAGLERRRARRALRARGRGAVFVRAQADEHGPHRRGSAGARCSCSPRARPTCCSRGARSELVGEETRPLERRRGGRQILAANDELAGQALRTLGVAYRALPADAVSAEEMRRARRARPGVRGADRHDRSAARRGAGTRSRARRRAGIRPHDDHRRPSEDRRRDRPRARHRRATGRAITRRRARTDVATTRSTTPSTTSPSTRASTRSTSCGSCGRCSARAPSWR